MSSLRLVEWTRRALTLVYCRVRHIGTTLARRSTQSKTSLGKGFMLSMPNYRQHWWDSEWLSKRFTCQQYRNPLTISPWKKPLPSMLKVPYPNEFGKQYHKFWGTLWTHPILGKRQICTLVRLAYDYVKGLL